MLSLQDRHWDRLLRYCADNGSYLGCPLPEPEAHVYPEEEQLAGNLNAVQYPTEQYPDQTQRTVEEEEEEERSNLPKVFPDQYPAQYQKNPGHDPDSYKHSWNVDAPPYRPQRSYQAGQCSQQVDLVPSHAVNPDCYRHTWNIDSDPVNPVPHRGDNPDQYKHTWNVDPDPVDPVPPQADNPDRYKHTRNVDPVPTQTDPDWYKHTWNVKPDPVNPVQAAEPAGALEVEGRVFWSDLSQIEPTGWDD